VSYPPPVPPANQPPLPPVPPVAQPVSPPPVPPVNPYDAYEQQQAYLAQHPEARQPQGQQFPPPQGTQAPPPPGYMANGFPTPPVFATGKAQGQAERNIGKTIGFRLIVGPIVGLLVLGLLFAIGGVMTLFNR
jgi:hypothetical protein